MKTMKTALLILSTLFAITLMSCEKETIEPPCNGSCGTIISAYANGQYTLQQTSTGLIMVNTHFICRIENECSGEQANFVLAGRDGTYTEGKRVCSYQ